LDKWQRQIQKEASGTETIALFNQDFLPHWIHRLIFIFRAMKSTKSKC